MVPQGATHWIAVAVTGMGFPGMVASDGFRARTKPLPVAVASVHQILSVITALSSVATFFLVLAR
jgi:hypothetical protein